MPKASEELEARESLAAMAASSGGGQEIQALMDGETFIEKYTRTAAAVDELLRLDKLRQQVAVRELIAQANKAAGSSRSCQPPVGRQTMRKTFSVPNFRHMMKSSLSLDSLSSSRSTLLRPSESFQDLNCELGSSSHGLRTGSERGKCAGEGLAAPCEDLEGGGGLYSRPAAGGPLRRLPLSLTMSTLHEERGCSRPLEDVSPDRQQEGWHQAAAIEATCLSPVANDGGSDSSRFSPRALAKSQTVESLSEQLQQQQQEQHAPPKNGSPSLLSSGYESQAVSLTTLSSEDSLSVRSMSVEDENLEGGGGESDVGRLADLTDGGFAGRHANSSRPSLTEDDRSVAVVRRNHKLRNWNKQQNHRLSCPSRLVSLDHQVTSSRTRPYMDNSSSSRQHCRSSTEGINNIINNNNREDEEQYGENRQTASRPDWLAVGESVQIRPSNLSGVVRFVGPTQFAAGVWAGVELDTSRGKNDGSVDGVRYFTCAARRGMFVRPKSLKLDRRGREMRAVQAVAAGTLSCQPIVQAGPIRVGGVSVTKRRGLPAAEMDSGVR